MYRSASSRTALSASTEWKQTLGVSRNSGRAIILSKDRARMFHGQYVEGGTADMAVVDSMIKSRFVRQAAAAAVDEHGAFLHFLELFVLEYVACRFVERHVK